MKKLKIIILIALINLVTIQFNKANAQINDAILAVIATWIDRAVAVIKRVGESAVAQVKLLGDKAELSSKKNQTTTLSLVDKEITEKEIRLKTLKNTGVVGRVAKPRVDANGNTVVDQFWVSAIAPSGCIAEKKAEANEKNIQAIETFKDSINEVLNENYVNTNLHNNTGLESRKLLDMTNKILNADANNVSLSVFPDHYKIFNPSIDVLELIAAISAKFSFDRLPVDMEKIDENQLEKLLMQPDGQDWLSYQFISRAIFDIVSDSFSANIKTNVNGTNTSEALEEIKDYEYATSFKRTLSGQVKFEAGNLMEMDFLLKRILSLKIKENEELRKENDLLVILGIKRVREMRSRL